MQKTVKQMLLTGALYASIGLGAGSALAGPLMSFSLLRSEGTVYDATGLVASADHLSGGVSSAFMVGNQSETGSWGGIVSRFIGDGDGGFHPYLQFSLSNAVRLDDLSYTDSGNATPMLGGDYRVQLQYQSGAYDALGSWTNIGASYLNPHAPTQESIDLGGLELGAGTWNFRWDAPGAFDHWWGVANTGTAFLEINHLAVNGSAVPEPGSLALFGLGLVGLTVTRRKQA